MIYWKARLPQAAFFDLNNVKNWTLGNYPSFCWAGSWNHCHFSLVLNKTFKHTTVILEAIQKCWDEYVMCWVWGLFSSKDFQISVSPPFLKRPFDQPQKKIPGPPFLTFSQWQFVHMPAYYVHIDDNKNNPQRAGAILNKISKIINKIHTVLISVLQEFQKCIAWYLSN